MSVCFGIFSSSYSDICPRLVVDFGFRKSWKLWRHVCCVSRLKLKREFPRGLHVQMTLPKFGILRLGHKLSRLISSSSESSGVKELVIITRLMDIGVLLDCVRSATFHWYTANSLAAHWISVIIAQRNESQTEILKHLVLVKSRSSNCHKRSTCLALQIMLLALSRTYNLSWSFMR